MGMFDDIIFEKAPVKCKCGNEINEFQTKQFDRLLETYKVTKRNKFKIEIYKYRKPRKSEQSKIGKITVPLAIKEHKGWKTLKLTDTIYCHTSCDKCNKQWFDVEMIWTKGTLDELKVKKSKL